MLALQSRCIDAKAELLLSCHCRLSDVESGRSTPADSGVTPGAIQPVIPTQSVLQPDKPGTQHKSKASEDWQSQKGKPAPASGQPSQKHKKDGTAVNPQGQVKSKNKKNRLGQRARQQLGRAKEAGLNQGQLRQGFLVSFVKLYAV